MTLRQKTLLLISLLLGGLFLILSLVSQVILLTSFARLEQQDTRQNVERARDALFSDLANLDALAADWAKWDDTYAFVEEGGDDYTRTNLVGETFSNLRLNLLLFVHTSGRLVYGKAFDWQTEQEVPVPPGVLEHLSPAHPLWRSPDARTSVTGIVLLPEGPLLVAAWPILTSEGQGPARGTLIMGRWLDEAELARLAAQTHLTLAVQRCDAPQLPPDWRAVWPGLSAETPIAVRPLDSERVAGYVLIADIYDQPGLVMRAELPRRIYQQGQASVQYYLLSLLAIGLAFGVTALLLVEKMILSRLARLHADVSCVSRDPAARVQVPGRDELSSLAVAINEVLDSLERSGQALRESKEFNESIIQSMTEGIAVEDAAGYFTFVNPAAEALLGYAPGELMGQHWTVIVPPDQQPIVQAADERRTRGEADRYELELVRKDGTRLSVLVAGCPRFEGGRFAGTLAVFTDITERKATEAERLRLLIAEREQRELAETLLQAASMLSASLDREQVLQLILGQLARVVEYDSASVILLIDGVPCFVAHRGVRSPEQLLAPEQIQARPHVRRVLEQRAPIIIPDTATDPDWLHRPSSEYIRCWLGVPLVFQNRAIGLLNLDKEQPGFYTARHAEVAMAFATQAAIAIENAQLFAETQAAYEQLKQTQAQLVQSAKMAAIGQLAAGVAHEINNPMTSVLGFAELLLRNTAPEDPAHHSLTVIIKEARRVREIVSGLLSFARQTEFRPTWAAVNQLVQDTLDLVRRRLEKGGVVVVEHYAPILPLLMLDVGRMKQVFLNLIVNALHAMPQGGTLTVTTELVGNEVAVRIADTGVGIPPENLPRIFEPFFTTQPVGQGTGLGLSISLGIVQDHEGRIEVASQVGMGSTFTVWLPVRDLQR